MAWSGLVDAAHGYAAHKDTGDVTGRMEMVQTRCDLVRFETECSVYTMQQPRAGPAALARGSGCRAHA